jgi:hypothetical protein
VAVPCGPTTRQHDARGSLNTSAGRQSYLAALDPYTTTWRSHGGCIGRRVLRIAVMKERCARGSSMGRASAAGVSACGRQSLRSRHMLARGGCECVQHKACSDVAAERTDTVRAHPYGRCKHAFGMCARPTFTRVCVTSRAVCGVVAIASMGVRLAAVTVVRVMAAQGRVASYSGGRSGHQKWCDESACAPGRCVYA